MKRGIIVVSILGLIALVAGGRWWVQNSPEQVIQFLIDGGLEAGRAERVVASIGGQVEPDQEDSLAASGSIEGEEVSVVSELGARIVRIDAAEGDDVESGQVLVVLDDSALRAQVSQAEAGVNAAQANLASVKAGVHPAEILAAEASLLQAEAERNAAQRALQDAISLLENPQEIQAQIVEARSAVALSEAQVEQARAQIAKAEAERHTYRGQGSMQEKGMYRVYDYQVQAAEAGLAAAEADKTGAEKRLAALQALRENPLAIAGQVNSAEAQLEIAEAGVEVAEAKLVELKARPTSEELAVADAQVSQAEARVSALGVQLDKTRLHAPMSGLVTSRSAHPGEAAIPGAILLTVANLDEVHLTIYVPEDELGKVYLGQDAEVTVDSFPSQVFEGTVSYIAQQAEFTPKNVQTQKDRVNMVFAVRVRLPNPGHQLKPGMPADAVLR